MMTLLQWAGNRLLSIFKTRQQLLTENLVLRQQLVILNPTHLHRILRGSLIYDNTSRTHLSLDKDAPERRGKELAEMGKVHAIPMVGGLHHCDTRRAA